MRNLLITLIIATTTNQCVAQDYLGRVSSNPFLPDSTANPFSLYNNEFYPDSPKNPFGIYGNEFSPYSANNPFAVDTPQIYGQAPNDDD